jgi:hypothetical protein
MTSFTPEIFSKSDSIHQKHPPAKMAFSRSFPAKVAGEVRQLSPKINKIIKNNLLILLL